MLVLLAGLFLLSRHGTKTAIAPDPYARNLQVSAIEVSRANNFVGATVTYLDCRVTNAGTRRSPAGAPS